MNFVRLGSAVIGISLSIINSASHIGGLARSQPSINLPCCSPFRRRILLPLDLSPFCFALACSFAACNLACLVLSRSSCYSMAIISEECLRMRDITTSVLYHRPCPSLRASAREHIIRLFSPRLCEFVPTSTSVGLGSAVRTRVSFVPTRPSRLSTSLFTSATSSCLNLPTANEPNTPRRMSGISYRFALKCPSTNSKRLSPLGRLGREKKKKVFVASPSYCLSFLFPRPVFCGHVLTSINLSEMNRLYFVMANVTLLHRLARGNL